jgi:hypothetical protein
MEVCIKELLLVQKISASKKNISCIKESNSTAENKTMRKKPHCLVAVCNIFYLTCTITGIKC